MTRLNTYRQQILDYIESERTEFTHDGMHTEPEWPKFTKTINDDYVEFDWTAPGYPETHQVGLSLTSGDRGFADEISYLICSEDNAFFNGHLPFTHGALAMLVAYILDNAPKKVAGDANGTK